LLGIGLYNPKVEIDISSETINNSVDEQLPITANVPVIKLTGLIDELDIQLLGDGTALINFNAEGELENGTTFSAKGTASSKLWYEDGKIYLEEPWVENIDSYDYELKGKEKFLRDTYKKSQSIFNKVTGKNVSINPELIDKAKDKLSSALEYVPIYNLNQENSLKGWLLTQATGDIIINENKVTAVLYQFGLMLKGILFGSFLIVFVIAAIRNPQIIADLYRLS
jgi:hypothetical protein